MRRQLNLDDTEDNFNFKIRSVETEGSHQIGINTDQFKMKSISIQTIIKNGEKQEFSVQVDGHSIANETKLGDMGSPNRSPNQGQDSNEEEQELQEQTAKKLTKFLRKISPLMEKQLSENLPKYSQYGKNSEPTFFKRQTRLTHTLENLDSVTEEDLEISDVSWNATGVIVAAAYAKNDHEGTCSHKSMICLWGLFKRNFKPTRPQIISTPNCINCLTFHPKKPSIIACGSYVGEILLYDFSRKDQQLLSKTVIDDYFHRDIISKLNWWPFRPPGKPETNYNILSLGTDGKILLWEVPNQSIAEDASPQRLKMLLKYPIKGFLMLRKKEGAVIPVSGLAMNQSKVNRNVFIVGSEGGSILKATLSPINHFMNSESKAVLDLQQTIKFKNNVYPFLLNLPPKNLPDVKSHVEKYCAKQKTKQVESLATVFNSGPQIRTLYPNPITYAYEPLAFAISSISDNKYGLFIANGYDGYSRIYIESAKINLESIEEGLQWGWVNDSHLMAGFIGQQWVVVDWISGNIVWSVGIGEGTLWREQSRQVAIVCERTKVKVVELGDKLLAEDDNHRKEVVKKIANLKVQ